MPTYTIFAGVNGAGKTSIYKSIYYHENKDEKRINTDEMIASKIIKVLLAIFCKYYFIKRINR